MLGVDRAAVIESVEVDERDNVVVAEGRAARDPFEHLRRVGIDEISYKKGHRYLLVVVDHDTGRLVWAAVGRDKKTLRGFFDLLGEERCAKIRLVSADAADGSPRW